MRRLILFSAVAVSVACILGAFPAVAVDVPAAKPVQPPRVSVVQASMTEMVETLPVTGSFVARHEILVSPEIDGPRLLEVLVEEGQRVRKGDVLARLSRETLETQLAQLDASVARSEAGIAQALTQIDAAQAAVAQTQPALARARSLGKNGFATEAAVDQAETAARTAEAQLTAAREGHKLAQAERASAEAQRREVALRLARTEIKSPADGVILRKNARVGVAVSSAAEPLFRIIGGGEIELDAEIPETSLHRLATGQPARIFIGDTQIAGQVRLVLPEVDRMSRLGRARLQLSSTDGLHVGAFARAEIETRRQNSLAVPVAAVLFDQGGSYVQTIEGNQIVTRRVQTGLNTGGQFEILSGLSEGVPVVGRAGAFLRHGDAVSPVASAAAGHVSVAPLSPQSTLK